MQGNRLSITSPPVAPAQAGAYRAYRFSLTHDIGTSLRWYDGVLRMLLTMSGVR